MNDIVENVAGVSRGRKRLRSDDKHKKAIAKKNRNSGESYVTCNYFKILIHYIENFILYLE
jgi:hypothetical protein